MSVIRDFKGRPYNVLETTHETTLLECVETGSRVRIRAWGWNEIGFVKP